MGEHAGVSRRLSHRVGRSANTGSNGLWLRYTRYFGEWNDRDLAELSQRLQSGQVRDAYCHVRYIMADGNLRFRNLEHARRLTAALHPRAER